LAGLIAYGDARTNGSCKGFEERAKGWDAGCYDAEILLQYSRYDDPDDFDWESALAYTIHAWNRRKKWGNSQV
jgi:hypothetical protein